MVHLFSGRDSVTLNDCALIVIALCTFAAAVAVLTIVMFGDIVPPLAAVGVGVFAVVLLVSLTLTDLSEVALMTTVAGFLLLTCIALSAYASHEWGASVRDGSSQSSSGPTTLDLTLPVSRGFVTVGESTVCVDRIGTQVFVGADSTVVVETIDRFLIVDCQRQNLSDVFPEAG